MKKDSVLKTYRRRRQEIGLASMEGAGWGEIAKEIDPTPATKEYTKFLSVIAGGNVEAVQGVGIIETPFEKTKLVACIIAAMTPFMMLHAYLGQELNELINELQPHLEDVPKGHVYKKWVIIYSSEIFQEESTRLEKLLDKLSVALTPKELQVIEKIYHQAMTLLIEFFSAQPVDQRTAFPLTRLHDPADGLVVFSGFDLTCTLFDSSAILVDISIDMAAKADDTEDDNSIPLKSSSDLKKSWEAVEKLREEYEQLIENAPLVEPYNYEALYNGLEGISNFEKQANARVFESGLLNGININDIKIAGEHMILQDGCADFFPKVVKKKNELNAEIHIISYCWCADLIRSSISSGCLSEVTIHSNVYENSVSTGDYIRNIESPRDKLEAFKNILSKCSSKPKHLSVYIGYTVSDLLCLVTADVGIVIGENARLRKLGNKFGVGFTPLHTGLICTQMVLGVVGSSVWKAQRSGVLYTVSNWSEIVAFFFGLEA